MSAHLLPCPSCRRHVRVNSDACPFCTFLLSEAFRTLPARPQPARRLSRAATFAFGAALASAAACGPTGDAPPAPPSTVQPTPTPPDNVAVPAYGGPPPMPQPPVDNNVDPAYGAPPAVDQPGSGTAQPTPPPPPGPSGPAHSGVTAPPRQHRGEDPGNVVALYGVPFNPDRIGGGTPDDDQAVGSPRDRH